ncbi:MAG: SH3 domain-containing protein [Ruminiclostridium sp.]|jgi:cell wall-associated NlpC family hydrolase|nr:SH3 domain-containing protein [Ruminiclostridium sp.]
MKIAAQSSRILASTLAAVSLFSAGALAAPASTAIQVEREPTPSSAIQATANNGSPVTVTAEQAEGSFQVVYQDQEGQESSATVTASSPEDVIFACVVTEDGSSLRVRQGPGTSYPILCSVDNNTVFPKTGKTDGWVQIACNGRTGYVSEDYIVEKTTDELLNGGGSTNGNLTDSEYDGTLAQEIVNYALQFEGYPYVYGTAGPNSFDCSGFTSYVFNHFGYKINRTSRDQLKNGVPVEKSELQPADLLLFSRNGTTISHVGLYIGNGKFIHASTSTTGVIISDLNSTYYVNHYFAARRII